MSDTSKAELRAALLEARSSLDAETRYRAGRAAVEHLVGAEFFARIRSIALYAAFRGEADPEPLAHVTTQPLRVAYPKIVADAVVFRWVRPGDLEPGRMGIREPRDACAQAGLDELDLIVVPGLGFTRSGERIGYGRGHYDRTLRSARELRPDVLAIGFAFEAQVVERIPTEAHDERLDGVVTENGLTWARRTAL